MTELEERVAKAQEAYYNGQPIMSDVEFDELWDQLPADSELKQEVGADHTDGFLKAEHVMLMGSQNKANTAEEMDRFFKKGHSYLAQLKLDGISVEIQYVAGKLGKVLTRGDGCLDFDTILETDKGPLKIGDIVEHKIKCNVKAKNLETGEVIMTPITNWYINENNADWYELQTDDGKTVKVTGNHLVWLPKKGCFRQVQDLVEGDEFDILENQ